MALETSSSPAAEALLAEVVVPLRLAVLAGSGTPRVLSLWYLWRDGALWCATSPTAWVVARLRADARCGFEVAGDRPPYRGVRGEARAELLPDAGGPILEALLDRYLGGRDSRLARWLLARAENEMGIRIVPSRVSSWDYTRRMT